MLGIIFFYILIIGYLGLTIYLANREVLQDSRQPGLRLLLILSALVLGFLGLSAISQALASQPGAELSTRNQELDFVAISMTAGFLAFALGGGGAVFSVALLSFEGLRMQIGSLLRTQGSFKPESIVHITAIILSILLVVGNIILFITGGGTEGVTESIEESGNSVGPLLIQTAVQVAAALLGVGYLVRRDLQAALKRLGLRIPTQEDILYGFGGAFFLYGMLIIFGALVSVFLNPDELQQQSEAAEALVQSFSTLPLAVMLSASAAIGEEVLFRGAIQPVFGNLVTSFIFVLLHSQVLGSPIGLMVLLIVSVGLGLLRNRYSTTTCIIAHFIYNFTVLSLAMIGSSSGAA